ncbi:MAG: hypothetical protein VX589_19160 [Myxococcota bacterium]|nr:hypothetical protein [Myxococcota bacterium]
MANDTEAKRTRIETLKAYLGYAFWSSCLAACALSINAAMAT